MNKNTIITAGLISTLSCVAISNESHALNRISNIAENLRSITQLNKIGRVKNVASNDVLNVRIKPDANSSLVFTLKNATEIKVLGQDIATKWYKVSYNGQEGYASNRYIELIGDIPSTTGYKTTMNIYLRKSASWSAEKDVEVKKDTVLDVLSIENSWAKISYAGKILYAPISHLEKVSGGTVSTPSEPSQPSQPSTPSQPSGDKYKTTMNIYLRKSASWSAEKDVEVKKDTVLDVLSIENSWAKISYAGKILYAPISHLEKVSGDSTTTPSEPSTPSQPSTPSTPQVQKGMIATVNTDGLNIRAGGGMSYSILAKANKGDIVLIKEEVNSNGWYKVELTTGVVGWCYEDYLENFREGSLSNKPSEDNSNGGSTNSSVVSGQIATVNTDGLNVRSGTETMYPVLSVVNTGDTVLIKEKKSNGWYKVQLSNGIIGWCNGIYLEDFKSGSIIINSNGKTQETREELINKVITLAHAQIGKPYKYGATGPGSFDCSGLAQYVFKNAVNINLPRNSKAQAVVGDYVSKANLQPGDLVFFNTSGSGISHLGIYIGNDEMIHAPSSGKNVQIVKITQSYWASRYVTARRIIY